MHFWNVLYPNSPEEDNLRIIDWNMWDTGSPTDDLAYLMGLHWYPERRTLFEKRLLECYHSQLVECGINSYSWHELWHNYRLSILRHLLTPVWQWWRGIHPGIWWSHLERGMLAFDDLNCAEFFS